MQAIGIGTPVLNLKSQAPARAQGYPAQDQFQSILQQRILSRGFAKGKSSTISPNLTGLKAQLSQAQPVSSDSATSRLFAKMPKFSIRTATKNDSWDPIPLHLTEKLIARTSQAQNQTQSANSSGTVDFSAKSGKTDQRSRALALLQGNPRSAQYAAAVVPAPLTEMPAALKGLMELLNQQPGQTLKISPDQVPQVKDFLIKAGLPQEQVNRLLNSPDLATKGLTATDLQAAWQEASQNSQMQSLAAQMAQGTQAATTSPGKLTSQVAQGTQATTSSAAKLAAEMPPALKGLVEFLNQQPGQNLKVPQDRLPEMERYLLKAGITPEQVQNLLNSPRFQEQGLTAADVQSAWQNSFQGSLQQAQASLGLGSLQDLTSQSEYRQMWEKLTLPPQALGDLRLELQQLGVTPETVANLNTQNYPQGITLKQVWDIIQQVSNPAAATSASTAQAGGNTSNASPPSPLLLNGGKEVEKWRQLLVQAGMDPEVAQTLASGPNPVNREELRTSLLEMAPPATNPQEAVSAKPLYLPKSLRVQPLPFMQQSGAGQGGSGDGGQWTQDFTLSSQVQQTNPAAPAAAPDLNNFLALLSGGAPVQADQTLSGEAVTGNSPAVNSLLTPEAREALWSQVQTGIMGHLRPGNNQITLTLNPPEMGKLQLSLNVRGDTVEVAAVASQAAVAEAGAAGVQQLSQALQQQGLTLVQFQFHHQDQAPSQSNLAFFQNSGSQRQAGKKDPDRWEQPANPRRPRWGRSVDCFA